MSKSTEENVTINFYHKGIMFDDLPTLLRVYKTGGLTLEQILSEYICLNSNAPIYLDAVKKTKKIYSKLEPYTPREVFKEFKNQEQKMCLLSLFAPEDIAKSLESEVIDIQTVTKKQTRTVIKDRSDQNDKTNLNKLLVDDVSLEKFTYDDTYELRRSNKSVLGTDDDIYFVKCKDTSTDRTYYLFVDPEASPLVTKDAIAAIASTMRKEDNSPLTKKEYLELIASET